MLSEGEDADAKFHIVLANFGSQRSADEAAPGTLIADVLLFLCHSAAAHIRHLVFKTRRSHDPNRSLLRSNRLGPPI